MPSRMVDDEVPHAAHHLLDPSLQDGPRGHIEVAVEREHFAGRRNQVDVVVVGGQLVDRVAEGVRAMRVIKTGEKFIEQFGLAFGHEREVVFDRVGDAAQEVAQAHRHLETRGQQLDAKGKGPRDTRQHGLRVAIDVDGGIVLKQHYSVNISPMQVGLATPGRMSRKFTRCCAYQG